MKSNKIYLNQLDYIGWRDNDKCDESLYIMNYYIWQVPQEMRKKHYIGGLQCVERKSNGETRTWNKQ